MKGETRSRWIKWAAATVATIILGALGSGLWEVLIGPSVHQVGRLCLSVISWAFDTFRDSMYQEVAKDLHEGSAEWILGLLVAMLVATQIVLITAVELLLRFRERIAEGLARGTLSGFMIRWRYLAYLYLLLACAYFFVESQRRYQVNLAITHYRQSFAICAPFLATQEQLAIRAKFAQIRNKQDYQKVLAELEAVAQKNGQNLPLFDPW